jgi:hypothetical protein
MRLKLTEWLLCTALESSCLICVAGGDRCQRCEFGGDAVRHEPSVSFHDCIDILVRHGARNTPDITAQCKLLLRLIFPHSRPHLHAAVQHFVAASVAASTNGAGPRIAGSSIQR